jgi:hypothetical protein
VSRRLTAAAAAAGLLIAAGFACAPAESTIFGLLTTEALDADPDVAAIAQASARVQARDGQQIIEAEAASLTGPAAVMTANPVNTGESQWSGGAYVQLATGSTLSWTIPADDQPRLVQAIVNRVPGPGAVSDFASGTQHLGAARYGGGGPQGISPAPDALLPVTLPGILPANATALTASTLGGTGQLDAVLLTPLIAVLITAGQGHSVALLNSEADTQGARTITLPGTGPIVATSYNDQGREWRVTTSTGSAITVPVPPGGFAIVQR